MEQDGLKPEHRKAIQRALSGDLGDAKFLLDCMESESETLRIAAFKRLTSDDVAPKVIRACLDRAWKEHHSLVIRATGSSVATMALFKRAAFPIQNLPKEETLLVWRGASGLSFDQAAMGPSWTLRRDVACWWACGHAPRFHKPGTPLLLRARIRRAQVIYFQADTLEDEIIFCGAPELLEIDGNEAEWVSCAEREESARQREFRDGI